MTKDEKINSLWERSGHGTQREDIEAAFNAGVEAAFASAVCGTCKYRSADGHCKSEKLNEDCGFSDSQSADMLVYDYAEGGGFWVGERFGCVHHTPNTGNTPSIPTRPCFKCGVPTNETQSVHGVGHYLCFVASKLVDEVELP